MSNISYLHFRNSLHHEKYNWVTYFTWISSKHSNLHNLFMSEHYFPNQNHCQWIKNAAVNLSWFLFLTDNESWHERAIPGGVLQPNNNYFTLKRSNYTIGIVIILYLWTHYINSVSRHCLSEVSEPLWMRSISCWMIKILTNTVLAIIQLIHTTS